MREIRAKQSDSGSPSGSGFSARARVRKRRKEPEIIYPESDGKSMADNTKQFDWIVKIKENLERMFADRPDVFVAGDLLWYPVKGNNKIRTAPDAMVAFGRSKGHRGSYRTWDENNVSPQAVFEILSPGNRKTEMEKKRLFYQRHGVMEYYVYDPDRIRLSGWNRSGKRFRAVEEEKMRKWISPLLNIRFDLREDDLHIFFPDGKEFLTPLETARQYDAKLKTADQRAEAADKRAKAERQKAKTERQRAEAADKRAKANALRAEAANKRLEAERREKERLAAKLRELGISPDQL